MEVMEWIDSTIYRRGNKKVATCWTYKTDYLTINVLTGHINAANQYVMHCRELELYCFDLRLGSGVNKDIAFAKALCVVEEMLNNMLQSIQ